MTLKELLETKGQDGDVLVAEYECKHIRYSLRYAPEAPDGAILRAFYYAPELGTCPRSLKHLKPLLLLRADLRPETLLKQLESVGMPAPVIYVGFLVIWRAETEEAEEKSAEEKLEEIKRKIRIILG